MGQHCTKCQITFYQLSPLHVPCAICNQWKRKSFAFHSANIYYCGNCVPNDVFLYHE